MSLGRESKLGDLQEGRGLVEKAVLVSQMQASGCGGVEPQRGRGMDKAPMDGRAKGIREAGTLRCTLPLHCKISDMITGDTGTYQISWHPGLDTEKSQDLGITYQAHLVFKALPSIITGFLLTEEEGHLQRWLQLCLSGTNDQRKGRGLREYMFTGEPGLCSSKWGKKEE